MQLEPDTWNENKARLAKQGVVVSDPNAVRDNIMAGGLYLSGLLKKYNGNVDIALAAYNAGPGAVNKYGGVPPYPETRNYIRRIDGLISGPPSSVANRQPADTTQASSGKQVGLSPAPLLTSGNGVADRNVSDQLLHPVQPPPVASPMWHVPITRDNPFGLPSLLPPAPSLESLLPNSTATSNGDYTSRTDSATGRNCAKVVQNLARYAGTDANSALGAGHCATEMRTLQWGRGNKATWPIVPEAKDLLTALKSPEYSKYWEQVANDSSTDIDHAPQGAIAVWGGNVGEGNGHVATIYHQNGHTYLLGNTSGKYSYDVSRLRGGSALRHPVAYYLPR
jgi:hypothetical protein